MLEKKIGERDIKKIIFSTISQCGCNLNLEKNITVYYEWRLWINDDSEHFVDN